MSLQISTFPRPWRRFFSRVFFLLLLVAPFEAVAQWHALATFPHAVQSCFLNEVGKPEIGFASSEGSGIKDTIVLWRTSDYGLTWRPIELPTDTFYGGLAPFDVTFKDSLVGLFAMGPWCWQTTDGGFNWHIQSS